MRVLPEAFNLATSVGLWEPPHWRSAAAKCSYKLYTCLSFSLLVALMISQVAATLFFTRTVEDFTEGAYMLLSTINACVKGGTILLRRSRVVDLARTLAEETCLPRNEEERQICLYFEKVSRYTVISCIILAELTVSLLAAWPVLFARGEFVLPLRAWHPFDVGSGPSYWLSYAHQGLSLLLVAAYDVANDTVIAGFMAQACAQLELMTLRLRVMSWRVSAAARYGVPTEAARELERRIVAQSVRHHLLIFRFTDDINTIFSPVILVQFCLSSVVLCVTIYQLSVNKSHGIEAIYLVLYLLSMLVEFFLYCWFGNEVTLKSLAFISSIYEMDWEIMHVKTLKELLIMMIRSTSPILMSCGPLITLSVESFMTMLKLSYSAFNVLQRSE